MFAKDPLEERLSELRPEEGEGTQIRMPGFSFCLIPLILDTREVENQKMAKAQVNLDKVPGRGLSIMTENV